MIHLTRNAESSWTGCSKTFLSSLFSLAVLFCSTNHCAPRREQPQGNVFQSFDSVIELRFRASNVMVNIAGVEERA